MKTPREAAVGRRGIALVHALVLGIFVIAITMGLTEMILQRYTATARRTESNTKTAIDSGTLARLNSRWAANSILATYPMGGYCSSFNDAEGTCTCSLSSCNCSCTCTVIGDATGAQTTKAAGSCAVTSPLCDQCTMTILSQ